jgi:hypothetical protein
MMDEKNSSDTNEFGKFSDEDLNILANIIRKLNQIRERIENLDQTIIKLLDYKMGKNDGK